MKFNKVKTTVGQILSVEMKKGEDFYAEPGAIVSINGDFEMKSGLSGGLGASAMRMLGGGENLFINHVKAKEDIEVQLASVMPGEFCDIELDGEGYILGDGVYSCHEGDVKISSKFGGLSAFTTGSGLMFLHVKGKGKVFVHGGEALFVKEVKQGETFYLDNGCFVGCKDDVKFDKFLAGNNILSKVVGREGIMLKFKGPCKVYYQTESPSGLAGSLFKFFKK
jgi:uncharacterized protein (TIGR00266 family)